MDFAHIVVWRKNMYVLDMTVGINGLFSLLIATYIFVLCSKILEEFKYEMFCYYVLVML
jgi:hypothetical protein